MRSIFGALVLLLALMAPAMAAKLTLNGDVTYRERIALPPGGRLTVELVDLAAPGVARIGATAAIGSPGGVPLAFSLNFDSSILQPGRAYGLRARIAGPDDETWFATATPYPVDPAAPAAPILIVVTRASADGAGAAPAPSRALLDATWRATTIRDMPVEPGVASTLAIGPDMRAGGRGGCNSWFAQAKLEGEALAFSAVAATRMACVSDAANAQEAAFFAAIEATRFWRLAGDRLTLRDAAGRPVMELDRRPY